jgi:hypothetical protein
LLLYSSHLPLGVPNGLVIQQGTSYFLAPSTSNQMSGTTAYMTKAGIFRVNWLSQRQGWHLGSSSCMPQKICMIATSMIGFKFILFCIFGPLWETNRVNLLNLM